VTNVLPSDLKEAGDRRAGRLRRRSLFLPSAVVCPICGGTEHRQIVVRENRFGLGDEFTYAICRHCRLVELVTVPRSMGRYYEGYSYHARNAPKSRPAAGVFDRVYRRLSALLMRPLERYRPRDRHLQVLDVGCANGAYLAELKKRGFRHLKGIEPSPRAVENRVDRDLDIVCTSMADFQTEERFDLVTLNQVFEHFDVPREMLLKLGALLAPGGKLVMSFPNYNSLARLMLGSLWPGYDAPRHYFTFNPGNARMLCEQCGLELNRVRYISRPSQFTGGFQYVWNRFSSRKQRLEDGFFRTSRVLDLLLYAPAYLLNVLKWGDMIELHIVLPD